MNRNKRKDMRLDELVGHLITIAGRIERETNGYMRFHMDFGPREQPPPNRRAVGKPSSEEPANER